MGVDYNVAATTVSALAVDAGASISIEPVDADSQAPGHQVALAPDATTVITVTVTAADGSVQATTARVTRAAPPSDDARLGTLQLSGMVLEGFSSEVTDYSVGVDYNVAATTVSALAVDAGASISIDPVDADSQAPGHQVALTPDATTVITVTVTAVDGSVQATTARVTRAAAPSDDARLGTLQLSGMVLEGFSSEVTDYSVTVDYNVAATTVSALAVDAGASISIDPVDADSQAPGHQVALTPDATTVITVTVTAVDGSVQATTARVTRVAAPSDDARLGTLQLSGMVLEGFSSGVTDYSVGVDYNVAATTVSALAVDAGASISIEPVDADSQAPGHQVALTPDATTVITVTVTAADGSVQATTARVTRASAPSDDARLGAVHLTGIDLEVPETAASALALEAGVTDYSVVVDLSVAEITVSATPADAGAGVSITPVDADAEAPGHQVALAAGATTVITLTVTAVDGNVQATTVRVTRAASSDARLGTLQLSGIILDGFSSEVTDYSVTANRTLTTVSATPVDARASISITPADAYPDPIDRGHQVALATDAITVITVTVTAADGSVQATTVRITHASAVVAALPAEMTRRSLLNTLRDRQITSVEDFVAELSPAHKRHVVLVYRSEALFKEFISGQHPRLVSWGADGRFVFSWSTNPASPGHEFVEFLKPVRDRWIAGVIDFSGSTPALREPAACARCHGQLNKPLWGELDEWLGTEGEATNTVYPFSPEAIAYTIQAAESTDPRIAPLDLGPPLPPVGGSRAVRFPDGQHVSLMREVGAVFAWRHDEVLFEDVRARANYPAIARRVVCAGGIADWQVKLYFEPADHFLAQLSDSGHLIQGTRKSNNGLYSAGYNGIGDGFAFLILHDLWQREPRVTAALADHAVELQAAHFEHFGTPGQAVLEARAHATHHQGDALTGPGVLQDLARELGPRACAALGGTVAHLVSGTAAEYIAVQGFSLVDAGGQVVEALSEGALVDLRGPAGQAAGIGVQVSGGAKVGHVALGLTGVRSDRRLSQSDAAAPYVLALPSALSVEEYYVSASAVPAPEGTGVAAPGLSLRFATILGSAALHAAWRQAPRGVWAAGERLWAVEAATATLVAYSLADGSLVGEAIALAAENQDPVGLWGDGATLWVAERTAGKLFAYSVADGSLVGEAVALAAENQDPVGLWGDGATLWVADRAAATLFAYAVADGSRLAAQDVVLAAENQDPVGLWADGLRLWVADGATGTLYAYSVADWSRASALDIRTGVSGWETAPVLVWSDGTTLWVADGSGERLQAFAMPPRADDTSLAALYLSDVAFGPFDPAILDYTAYVAHRVAATTVTTWARVGMATVVITPPDADAAAPGHQVALTPGASTAITVTVTDQATSRSTTVTVHRASATASADATLSGLSLSGLDIGAFDSGTVAYAAENADGIAMTTVTAAAADSGAQVAIEPPDADPAVSGHQVALGAGSVPIAVTVTAADQVTVRRYTVVASTSSDATLSGLSLSGLDVGTFAPGTLAYAVAGADGIILTTVRATATHRGAQVAVIKPAADADPDAPGHQVALGSASVTILVRVTAADRVTVRVYAVVVAPQMVQTASGTASDTARLSVLSLSGVALDFRPNVSTYQVPLPGDVSVTTVTAMPAEDGASVATSDIPVYS